MAEYDRTTVICNRTEYTLTRTPGGVVINYRTKDGDSPRYPWFLPSEVVEQMWIING